MWCFCFFIFFACDVFTITKTVNCFDTQLIAGYWALNKIYRPLFVVFDALHTYPEYRLYFAEEYQPEPLEIRAEEDLTRLAPALSTRAVHEACKLVESQYFHLSAAIRLPRILDPTQDAYWICNYLVDYLAKQVRWTLTI